MSLITLEVANISNCFLGSFALNFRNLGDILRRNWIRPFDDCLRLRQCWC